MAKDPAFLFYPNDWIGGTMGMTLEEKGAYMELLMMQFNRGHMTEHMIGLTIGHLWDKISDKFIKDGEGLWYNERLDEEKEKRKKYVKSRTNNKNGKNQYTEKIEKGIGHMTNHMENENKDKIKEGGTGETIKIDFIKNDKEPQYWQSTIKQFLNDFEFKKMCCSFYKCEWVELEDRMIKFIQGVHLKQNFQEIAALKVHFRNHYQKHYINGGLTKKEVFEIGASHSKAFIEAPKDFDYDQMENWSK